MDLHSFEEFDNFYKEKKTEFDNSCYAVASRTLAKILMESRLYFNNYQRDILKQYLS